MEIHVSKPTQWRVQEDGEDDSPSPAKRVAGDLFQTLHKAKEFVEGLGKAFNFRRKFFAPLDPGEDAEEPVVASRDKRELSADEKTQDDQANLWVQQARELYQQEKFQRAEKLFQRALAAKEKLWGNDHLEVAHVLRELGSLAEEQRQFEEALGYHGRALDIRESHLAPNDLDVAQSLYELAVVNRKKNPPDHAASHRFQTRALAIREERLGPGHLDVAQSLNSLGVLLSEMLPPDYEQAKECHERALTIRKAELGDEHEHVAQSLHNLAMVYRSLRDYENARLYQEQALDIQEKISDDGDDEIIAISLSGLGIICIALKDYDAAKSHLDRSLEINERRFGRSHPKVLSPLSGLADLAMAQRDFATAQGLYKRMIDIEREDLQRAGDKAVSDRLAMYTNNLAITYYRQRKYDTCLSYMHEVLTMQEELHGPDSPEITEALQNYANVLFTVTKNYDEVRVYHERAVAILEGTYGREGREIVVGLRDYANFLRQSGKFEESLDLESRALKILKEHEPADSPILLSCRNAVAGAHHELGQYQQAIDLYQEELLVREEYFGKDSYRVAVILNNLARVHLSDQNDEEAEGLLIRSLAIREQHFGPEGKELATVLTSLGSIHEGRANYDLAEEYYTRSLKIRKKHYRPNHVAIAIGWSGLASLSRTRGDFATAARYYDKALDIYEARYGPDHVEVSQPMYNLAGVLRNQGDLEAARPLYEDVLEIRRVAYKSPHPKVATALLGLSHMLQDQGDYAGSKPLLEEALAITRDFEEDETLSEAILLTLLAFVAEKQGDYQTALEQLRLSLGIRERISGKNHPSVATGANNLARIHRILGNYEQAQQLLERSLGIRLVAFGEVHVDVATNYNNLAYLMFVQGRYPEASDYHNKALNLRKRIWGNSHPDVSISLRNLSYTYEAQGEERLARRLVARALANEEEVRDQVFNISSEREQLAYVQDQQSVLNPYLRLHDRPRDTKKTYGQVLRWKGAVGEAQLSQRQVIFESDEAAELFAELTETRQQISQLGSDEQALQGSVARQGELASLTRKKERQQRELGKLSNAYKREQAIAQASAHDVGRNLPQGAVVVDFLRYTDYTPPTAETKAEWQDRYVAFVVSKPGRRVHVERVDLGPAQAIDDAISDYRDYVNAGRSTRHWYDLIDERAQQVTDLVWRPLQDAVGDNQTVFVVPDGAIAGISFAGLPSGEGRYLIEDNTFGYLENAGDLVRFAEPETEQRAATALVVGAVDYDHREEPLPEQEDGDDSAVALLDEDDASLSRRVACEDDEPWKELKATQQEMSNIGGLLKKHGYEVAELSGAEATEANFLQQTTQKTFLHLATHGFFASEDRCPSALDADANGYDVQTQISGYNPMVLSGVVLAGANQERTSLSDPDGILTAEEVSGMNLQGTDLVVLSACKTGLGEVIHGQGVMGLRRAFVQAGAETLVMSLWDVPDSDTQVLMELLYGEYFSNMSEMAKLEALRDAQLKLLGQKRDAGEHSSPLSWGGFISSGDWD